MYACRSAFGLFAFIVPRYLTLRAQNWLPGANSLWPDGWQSGRWGIGKGQDSIIGTLRMLIL